jgi:hypothetical protein
VRDDEDASLVVDALRDAAYKDRGFDFEKLARFMSQAYSKSAAQKLYDELLANAGVVLRGTG